MGFFLPLRAMYSKSVKSNVRKGLHLSSMLVFAVFFSSIFFVHSAFAATTPGCGFFDLSPECDLSGWFHLLLGDIIIGSIVGGLLAFLFHRLAIRTQKKLETIIESQESMRLRRKDYAAQHLKNLFNTLLFTIGVINKSTSNFNLALASETRRDERQYLREKMLAELRSDEVQMGRVLQLIRNTIIASNDILEPDIIDQIDGVCTFIGELSAIEERDGTMVFPKYVVCKIKTRLLIEKLQTYSNETHLFEGPKIENLQNQSNKTEENLKKGAEQAVFPGEIR
jgi:small-conductance mechanosensitive channel